MPELLLEIGLEEVPARMLAAAERELGERALALIRRERLATAETTHATFSTPRRLAVLVYGANPRQPDAEEQLTGPAWAIAFKDGAPTPASHAFAKKAGVSVEQLKPVTTPKGEYVSATLARPGRSAAEVLSELVPKEIAALGWPKPMYWRAGKPERFVRPVQWLVALLDDEIIPMEFAGIHAGRESRGHRVLHGPAPVVFATPASYVEALRAAHVEPDVEARRHTIRKALDQVTRDEAPGARWREDHALVDTVTHLTEWPSVLLGRFEQDFLALPEEVLVTVMRDHQKYFALEDSTGKLLPHFLTVLNAKPDEQAKAVIRHGNERVLRARFSDARFFWDFDQRVSLHKRVEMLKSVTFNRDLNQNYFHKAEYTRRIVARLAEYANKKDAGLNLEVLDQAAMLAKADLTAELVKEFTELQGIVGGLYARKQLSLGEAQAEAIAQAIYWQYLPASINDPIPPTPEGQVLGIADRIGTIVELFSIKLVPSGSKDPYALRRAGNAIVKILAKGGLPLSLSEVFDAADSQKLSAAVIDEEVSSFFRERLTYYLQDIRKLPADAVAAALAAGYDDVPDAELRAAALAEVRGSDELRAIAAAWKRSKNILRQAAEKLLPIPVHIDENLLAEEAERGLYTAATAAIAEVHRCGRAGGNYPAALAAIASLRPPIDRFFDATMVMAEDPALRANRLALLQHIVAHLGRLADFSELAPA